MGKSEGKRLLGRPRRRWEDNIKMDLREVGCDPGDWMPLAEDRMNGGFCKGCNKPLVQIRYLGSFCNYLWPILLIFYLPLKLRVVHIRNKKRTERQTLNITKMINYCFLVLVLF